MRECRSEMPAKGRDMTHGSQLCASAWICPESRIRGASNRLMATLGSPSPRACGG